ncbi:MAG: cupin domain-containing protein [Candidatus Kapaibacterium sp.]
MSDNYEAIKKPQMLENLTGYQDGTVASRTLLNKKNGTLTIFAFDQGQGLSEHTAPFDAFVQILDGEALITIGGVEHELSKGMSLLMPADIPHALKAVKKFKMLLTMIKS